MISTHDYDVTHAAFAATGGPLSIPLLVGLPFAQNKPNRQNLSAGGMWVNRATHAARAIPAPGALGMRSD